jgi:hypothetical protein
VAKSVLTIHRPKSRAAALRPDETSDLRQDNLVTLPLSGCGEMVLTHSVPRSGSHWTDSGRPVSAAHLSTGQTPTRATCQSTRAGDQP